MPPYDQTVIDRWMNNLKNMTVLVATYKNRIVGHASGYKFPNKRRTGLADLIIYIHQDFQRKGLGTQMLNDLITDARGQKLHKLVLEVAAENTVAVHLYQKVGFRIEGLRRNHFSEKMRNIMTSSSRA